MTPFKKDIKKNKKDTTKKIKLKKKRQKKDISCYVPENLNDIEMLDYITDNRL